MADNTNIYTLTLFYKRFLFIARDVCEHFYIKNKIKIISEVFTYQDFPGISQIP